MDITLGIILIIASPVLFLIVYFTEKHKEHFKSMILLISGFSAIGIGLIMQERITEIPTPFGGTIKTITAQALIDAKEIKDIKDRVANQSATIRHLQYLLRSIVPRSVL